jgi:hypothetical protein
MVMPIAACTLSVTSIFVFVNSAHPLSPNENDLQHQEEIGKDSSMLPLSQISSNDSMDPLTSFPPTLIQADER